MQAACQAHARRKSFDVLKLSPKDPAAIAMEDRMDAVLVLDAEARVFILQYERMR